MGYFRDNIEKLEGYTPGFQPDDLTAVKLNTNENPYPPSPAVIAAVRNIDPEKLRRYPSPLADEFRKAAAELNGVAAEQIMCSNGGDELLNIAVRAFCDKKRPLAYPTPTYSLYPVLAAMQNCPAIEIPFDSDFNLPAKLASTGAALTIVCNPNAPSGSTVKINELASLADELKKSILLIDEAYADFANENCISLVKNFKNVIILRSMSKGYSLAGMRLGYCIARPSIIEGLLKLKDSYNVDSVAIAAATAAIKDQTYFRQNIEKIKQQRVWLTEQLRLLGFNVPDSSSNFVLAKYKGDSAAVLYQQLVGRNIYVRYWDIPGLQDKLRITVGTEEQNQKLISALKEILKG